jgi:ferredoxin
MAKYKIIHYKKDCISCGACAMICPEFWNLDEDGVAQLEGGKKVGERWEKTITTEEDRAKIQETVDACPAEVIKLEETE